MYIHTSKCHVLQNKFILIHFTDVTKDTKRSGVAYGLMTGHSEYSKQVCIQNNKKSFNPKSAMISKCFPEKMTQKLTTIRWLRITTVNFTHKKHWYKSEKFLQICNINMQKKLFQISNLQRSFYYFEMFNIHT